MVSCKQVLGFRSSNLRWLVNFESEKCGGKFYRWGCEFVASPGWFIGLGPDSNNFMTRFNHAPQTRHGGLRRSHEDDAHNLSEENAFQETRSEEGGLATAPNSLHFPLL
jgi:hypothetical protein